MEKFCREAPLPSLRRWHLAWSCARVVAVHTLPSSITISYFTKCLLSAHPHRGKDTSLQRVRPNLAASYSILVHVLRIMNLGVEHYAFLPSRSSRITRLSAKKAYFSTRLVENYAFLPTRMSILIDGVISEASVWRNLGRWRRRGVSII